MKGIAFILVLLVFKLGAQITYVDIPDTTLFYPVFTGSGDSTNKIHFDINGDAINDLYFSARKYTTWVSPSNPSVPSYVMLFNTENNVSRMATTTTLTPKCPTVLNSGATINSGYIYSTYSDLYVNLGYPYVLMGCGTPYTDKFYALEFTFSSQIHYGWIRVDESTSSITFKDYAYNNIPSAVITTPNFSGIIERNEASKVVITNSGSNWVLKGLESEMIDHVKVLNIVGQVISDFTNNTSEIIIPNSELESSLYLIEVRMNGRNLVVKAMK